MKPNIIREKLDAGQPTIGTRIHSHWPAIVEVVGHTGLYDYVEYVGEYGTFTSHDLDNLCRAAELYDRGDDCAAMANAAKYLAGEATFKACNNAILTLGGMGYAKEFHVERYLREALIHRIAPITPHLILCYIAERVLGLPKSY